MNYEQISVVPHHQISNTFRAYESGVGHNINSSRRPHTN